MKKVIILLMIFAFLFFYPLGNFSSVIKEDYSSEGDTSEGVLYIENLASGDLSQAESFVQQAEAIRNYVPKTNAELVRELLEKIDKGEITYKKIFKNVYIMGDSLMNGLESYEILNQKKIISQVSATLEHLKANYKSVIKKEPEVLILHYGINMLGFEEESLAGFTDTYAKYIKKLKKALPETRIIVSSIFPVDRKVATAKRFGRIKAYNKAMKKMCKNLDVEYLNNSPLFKEIEYCYGSDGIHFPEDFYRNYWLKYVIEEMEIV